MRQGDPPPSVPDYELLDCIGHGAYGEVWLARGVTGIYHAVKTVHRSSFEDERPYEREFDGIRKYEPISRSVEGAVDILHVGRAADGSYLYYVMELADDVETGPAIQPTRYTPRTLREDLRRRGRLPAAECLQIATALTFALACLHEKKLVHRDIKPSNIVFVNGHAKLADIGLVTDSKNNASFVGTEGYVPPEGPGTPKADLYSLGIVLYEIVTGNDRQEYPALPTDFRDQPDQDAYGHLNAIILRACNKDRDARYGSAAEMLSDLHSAASRRAPALRPEANCAARRTLAVAAAALALLGLATLLWQPTWLGSGPVLRQVREFSAHDVPSWAPALVGCVNGDGEPELCVVAENRLRVFSSYGDRLMLWPPERVGADNLRLDVLADTDGDGCRNMLLGWRVGEELFISAVNSHGGVTHRFANKGTIYRQEDGRLSITELNARTVVDLEGDGRLEMLARLHTGTGGRPRGLCCYSVDTGELRWSFPTAPNVLDVACVDLDGDRVLDILLSTQAPSNGNTEADGTDDGHTYLFVLSGKITASSSPTNLWRVDLWDFWSQAHLLLDPTNRAIYVWSSYAGVDLSDRAARPHTGEIVRVGYDGSETGRSTIGEYLSGCTLVESNTNRLTQVAAIDHSGLLRVFSHDLTRRVAKEPFAPSQGRVQATFCGRADLDGDGLSEYVLLYAEEKHISGDNPGTEATAPTVRHFSNVSLVVLDSQLNRLATHMLADKMKSVPSISLWVGRLDKGQPNQILVLSDKVRVMELTRRRLFGF